MISLSIFWIICSFYLNLTLVGFNFLTELDDFKYLVGSITVSQKIGADCYLMDFT